MLLWFDPFQHWSIKSLIGFNSDCVTGSVFTTSRGRRGEWGYMSHFSVYPSPGVNWRYTMFKNVKIIICLQEPLRNSELLGFKVYYHKIGKQNRGAVEKISQSGSNPTGSNQHKATDQHISLNTSHGRLNRIRLDLRQLAPKPKCQEIGMTTRIHFNLNKKISNTWKLFDIVFGDITDTTFSPVYNFRSNKSSGYTFMPLT